MLVAAVRRGDVQPDLSRLRKHAREDDVLRLWRSRRSQRETSGSGDDKGCAHDAAILPRRALRDIDSGGNSRRTDVLGGDEPGGAAVVAPARVGPQRRVAARAIEIPARTAAGDPHRAAHPAIDAAD